MSGKVQVIDVTKLEKCTAVCDAEPPGHVSIIPADKTSVSDWASTRGTDAVDPHTADVINAIVGTLKVPKR